MTDVWVVTGVPGTGKTTLSTHLGKKMGLPVLHSTELVEKYHLGKWHPKEKEYEVDTIQLKKKILSLIPQNPKGIIIEGHLLCEITLPAKGVIVLTTLSPTLEERLQSRGYSQVKIQENLYCQETNYCQKKARKNYPHTPILVLDTQTPKKVIYPSLMKWIKQIQRGK